jgi:hypothetical protein
MQWSAPRAFSLELDVREQLGDEVFEHAMDPRWLPITDAALAAMVEHFMLDYAPRKAHPLTAHSNFSFTLHKAIKSMREHTPPDCQLSFPTAAKQGRDDASQAKPSADLPTRMQERGIEGIQVTREDARAVIERGVFELDLSDVTVARVAGGNDPHP